MLVYYKNFSLQNSSLLKILVFYNFNSNLPQYIFHRYTYNYIYIVISRYQVKSSKVLIYTENYCLLRIKDDICQKFTNISGYSLNHIRS